MKIGPRYKICKRLGSGVFEKCQTQKFELSKSRGGRQRGRRRRLSNYGEQLLEKQKVRYTYGMSEHQFRRYVDESVADRNQAPVDALFTRLETRLDNAVYRLGLAKTRQMARQLVSHGHIDVNGERVTVPSYSVEPGDEVAVRERSIDKGPFRNLKDEYENYTPPSWLVFDQDKKVGQVEGSPNFDPTSEVFDLTSVIEFYSR